MMAGFHIRGSHLKLIAGSHVRNSLRSGSGVIFLVLAIALNLVANRLHAQSTDVIPAALPTPPPVIPAPLTNNPGAPNPGAPAAMPPVESSTVPAGAGTTPTTAPATQPGN